MKKKNEVYNSTCVVNKYKKYVSRMHWVYFAWQVASPYVFLRMWRTMNGPRYYEKILSHILMSRSFNMGFSGILYTFMCDNLPLHAVEIVKDRLRNLNIHPMAWPPHFLDLSPTKNL